MTPLMNMVTTGLAACGLMLSSLVAPPHAAEAPTVVYEDAAPVAATCAPRPTDVRGALIAWRDGWAASPSGWYIAREKNSSRSGYEIYSRWNGLAFVTGVPVADAMRTLDQAGRAGHDVQWGWNWEDYSRVAEAALITGKSAAESARMLDDVYRFARQISSGWNDDDYARVARAALIMNIPAERAVRTLDQVYRETVAISSGWYYRDYSRMAAAVIISGKSPREAARALKATWEMRDISPNWSYADYSTVAAAALLGRGAGVDQTCAAFTKAW